MLKTGITIDECVKSLKLREKKKNVTEFCNSIIVDE